MAKNRANYITCNAAWLLVPDGVDEAEAEASIAVEAAVARPDEETAVVPVRPVSEGTAIRGLPQLGSPVYVAEPGTGIIAGEINQRMKTDHQARWWHDQRAQDHPENNRTLG